MSALMTNSCKHLHNTKTPDILVMDLTLYNTDADSYRISITFNVTFNDTLLLITTKQTITSLRSLVFVINVLKIIQLNANVMIIISDLSARLKSQSRMTLKHNSLSLLWK
ncbi:hypothetical protein M9Y10_036074 [Tritrichomonas musculus]|uniref:Uncharacterized protein n=1 Tax=Tritrichomonas musculus TaxID=1915356 RepID=A0ABR2GW78_9EUKA